MVNYKKYLDIEIFEGEISKHEYPWHFHNCYTIIMVSTGSIFYEFQDKSIILDETEILILAPFQVHRNIISQHTIYKAIFVPTEYFECQGQFTMMTQIVNQPNVVDRIVNIFHNIDLNPGKEEIKAVIWGLCEMLIPLQIENDNLSISQSRILPKIEHDLNINELAAEAHLSKFHFQRKFKKKHGLTVGQLKQQEKTIKAKTLLEDGKLSTDVAYELGFFDQSHFIKYFKKMWAITPKDLK
jgi:AraC-like DNA-binding protein